MSPLLSSPSSPTGLPAWQLRELVATGSMQVGDIVTAHLDRLMEVQPSLNAAVEVRREEALREAELLQRRIDAGDAAGPLAGVPFTVKDAIATAGTPTRCGSRAFAANVPIVDAVAVRRMRDAGAILIAKTNCPEFAFGVTTGNVSQGITRSPWGDWSPGGSSGGEAALVAAGASAIGLGTDYGGSLRWPAQSCGVIALRPGLDAVQGTGQLPEVDGRMDGLRGSSGLISIQRHFQVIGPLARTVADLAIALRVISGHPYEIPTQVRNMAIGWTDTDAPLSPVSSDVRRVIAGVAARLAERGHAVTTVPGAFDGLHDTFNRLRATDRLDDLKKAVGDRLDLLGPDALAVLESAPSSLADPERLWAELETLCARFAEQLTRTPIVLLPVAPASACDLDGSAWIDGRLMQDFALMAQCRAVTALGLPSLSIPVGRAENGMPISVQVIGGRGQENSVLQAALMLEDLYGGWQCPPNTDHVR